MPEMTEAELNDLIAGRRRRFHGNVQVPFRLTPEHMSAFEAAKLNGFVVVPKGGLNQEYPLTNAWHAWCLIHDVPYIWVRSAKNHARIEMDLVDYGDMGEWCMRALDDLVSREQMPKHEAYYGRLLVRLSVPYERVRTVCQSLRAFAQEHTERFSERQ